MGCFSKKNGNCVVRALKFRAYPSKSQERPLNKHLWICKNVWNECLAFVKQFYKYFQKFPSLKTLFEFGKKQGLYSQVVQQLLMRLRDGIQRKIDCKKKGLNVGFPRFKNFNFVKSLCYPQSGFELRENELLATPFGVLKIKQHRRVQGKVKTLTIKRESSGKWFAIFVVETDKLACDSNFGKAVGVDVGLKFLPLCRMENELKIHGFSRIVKSVWLVCRKGCLEMFCEAGIGQNKS